MKQKRKQLPEKQQPTDGKMLQWHPAFYADLQIEFREEKEKLNQPLQEVTAVSVTAKTQNMPVLYSVFNGQEEVLDDDTKKRYKKLLSQRKELFASVAGGAVGTVALKGLTGIGSLTGMAGATSGLAGVAGFGMMGMASAGMEGLLILAGPVGIALLGGGMAFKFVKKKAKSQEGKIASEKLEKLYENFQKGKENIQIKIQENVREMTELFEEYLPIALEKIKETSEKVMIQLDDFANMDQNKRIMQYQQIALNQYKEQQQLYDVLQHLQNTQQKIMKENQELLLRLQKYEECGNYVCVTNGLIE